jgi:chorismate--pyruvate lyase
MMKHVSETPVWRATTPPSLSFLQKYWLVRPGALTAGLRTLGQVQLQVVREYRSGLCHEEATLAGRLPGAAAWLREIRMSVDGITAVVARSYTPLHASHSHWQGLRQLRTRPLADILYNDPKIARSSFRVARVGQRHALFRLASQVAPDQTANCQTLPARCSVFWNNGQPLVVCECFLPRFWHLAAR